MKRISYQLQDKHTALSSFYFKGHYTIELKTV